MTHRPQAAVSVLALAALLLGGCGSNPNAEPGHTAEEQKLVDQMNAETPQQQIERIQKGPMPESAKPAMIQRIKDKYGLK